ncbi:hypothetical protein BFJ72_g15286 [Fusarium proliferatum]|uniref:DUF551 domain-containing protein n=1 Tax=Gibberella intermedia TaxID=948311 RepID=A0A420RK58_GIBIN|nr:hypothetical protein BFJ72_g15286 [Fusarium proliferatum]
MVWLEDEFCALWVWGDALLTEVDPSPDQPTHWMPLPAAPGEESPAALNLEAAAKKLAELFDYPWEHMPAEGRQNMRKNVEAVLLAAAAKESP